MAFLFLGKGFITMLNSSLFFEWHNHCQLISIEYKFFPIGITVCSFAS